MSTIIIPHRWTTQPQYPVEIDWGNPLTRGLVSVLLNGYDPTKKRIWTSPNSYVKKASQYGVAANLTSASSQYLYVDEAIDPSLHTLFAIARPLSSVAGRVMSLGTASGTARVTLAWLASNQFQITSDTGGTALSASVNVGEFYSVAEVSLGTGTVDRVLYVNNIATSGAITSSTGQTRIYVGCQVNSTPTAFFNGDVAFACAFSRALSAQEIKSLSDNPWQIFRQITKRIYVGVSSASTYTLTASKGDFTETGNAATLAYNRSFAASKGTFTLTGQNALFPRSRVFAADKGTFNLTGNAASFQYGSTYALTAESGSFALTGNTAVFPRSRVFAVDSGSIVLTGNDAILNYSGAADYSLSCSTGDFSLTGVQIAASKTVQEGKRLKFWTGTEWKA